MASLQEIGFKELTSMVGSAVGEIINSSRDSVFGVHDDEISGFQWSAILDGRTCKRCRRLDGRIFRKGDPALQLLGPQLHSHCRCILVAVTVAEAENAVEQKIDLFDKPLNSQDLELLLGTHPTAISVPPTFDTKNSRKSKAITKKSVDEQPPPKKQPPENDPEKIL